MKVECIDNSRAEKWLLKNKNYKVLSEGNKKYKLKDEYGYFHFWNKSRFKKVKTNKMKKEVKELLKEAYNSNEVCSKWKNKIKAVYPKVDKNVLEVGKWYKGIEFEDMIVFCENINDGTIEGYGFNEGVFIRSNDWFDESDYSYFRLATEEEVKQALIKEAKKRGFKEGVLYKSLKGAECVFTEFDYFWGLRSACKKDGRYGVIFRDGKWAEIIETITKEEAEKQLGKTII